MIEKKHKRLTSAQIIILGFAGLIICGCILLMLPVSTKDGQGALFTDALFTSTSAVCVTGLVVQDTATYWSTFGQGIILCLIQMGGMGVVTVSIAIAIVSGKKISLRQRSTMQDSINAPKMGGIVKLTGFIIKTTILFEGLGMLLMLPVFCEEFGIGKGIWYALFHSVSAFCNAGFDLMGSKTPYSSLTYFSQQPMINMVIMLLIIIGGIGFTTWDDIRINRLQVRKYRMQSKIILVTTACLIVIPAVYFFFFEYADQSIGSRIWGSLFQSVTTRTAGFNTMDLTLLSETGVVVMVFLMLVGGSPGSTAGGMKTTTLAIMFSTSISVFRRREHTHFFGRRISYDVIRNAVTILSMYLTLFLLGGCIISKIEGLPLISCLYETASAIGTVGLTLGITTKLSVVSRYILIVLMYFGRVGGLTLVFAAFSARRGNTARLPQEKLTVG